MTFRPSLVGDFVGVQAPVVLQAIGVGLGLFAADLLHQATRPRVKTWRALYASTADFLWVLGIIVLLTLFPAVLSPSGTVLAVAVGAVVLFLGLWQLSGIRTAHRLPDSGQYRHCLIVETSAPAGAMWQVVSRLDKIERYMPSLKDSFLRSGEDPGTGAVRICRDQAGRQWSEKVTEFDRSDRTFTVSFRDFPAPVESMSGGWQVTTADGGSQVMVWWELVPASQVLAPMLLPLLAFQADRDFPKIIGRMASEALGDVERTAGEEPSRADARLLRVFC